MAGKTKNVVVFGLIVSDRLAKVDELGGAKIIDIDGEEYVAFRTGNLFLTEDMADYGGGNVPNSGIPMSIMGLNVGAVGKIGPDTIGDSLRSDLEKHGIDTSHIIVDSNVQTSGSIGLVTEKVGFSGERRHDRTFIHNPGGHGQLTINDITDEIYAYIARADHLHVGYFGILPKLEEDLYNMLAEVKRRNPNITISLDTGGNQEAMRRQEFIDGLKRCLPYVDIFIPSIEEAQNITGLSNPDEIINRLSEWSRDGGKEGLKVVGLKMGADGAVVKTHEGRFFKECFPLTKIEDTTGGGDSFYAGFLTGYLKGKSIPECLELAHATAAVCVSAKGATTGISRLAETRRLPEGELNAPAKVVMPYITKKLERLPPISAPGGQPNVEKV